MSGSSQPGTIAIVGAGLAAATCCETLRASGFDGRLVLVGAEPHLPYERPPLSKGHLLGSQTLEDAFVHDAAWYDDQSVELRLGRPVVDLDLATHTLATEREEVEFDRLLLATGSFPRRLPMADDAGVEATYLRTLEDSRQVKAALGPGRRIAVLGAGWIGLEVASAARAAGSEVVVVEPAAHPLLGALGPEVGEVFATLHRAHGVDLRTGTVPAAITRADPDGGVRLTLVDGSSVTADALVVGIGVLPSTELADAAGLRVEQGIVTDAFLRTTHPDVYAAGDAARAYHPRLGRLVRVEHWDNAIEQGRVAALNLLGAEQPYDRLPYFFSDQYDVGLEYVGHVGPDGYDEVVLRGDLESPAFTAVWTKGGRVAAGMQVNDWDATDHLRRLVEV